MSGQRNYDGSGRQERAAERQAQIVASARAHFLADGFGATSLRSIAQDAGVSLELIHKSFGGKVGLVRAVYERSLLGSGAEPAPQRSDAAQEQEADLDALAQRLGGFTAEVAPLVAPLQLLVRDAAAGGDPAMIAFWQEVEQQRYDRMLQNARRLQNRGLLAAALTVEHVADVFWSLTGPDLYDRLVIRRGWSGPEYGRFIGDCIHAALTR